MKCNTCGKIINKNTKISMSVDGEIIARYCSKVCRSKAAQKMIQALEETGRNKIKKEKE
jgi:hypothetical protein